MRVHQSELLELRSLALRVRAEVKEGAAVINREGRRKEGRERGIAMLNTALVPLRTLEMKIDDLLTGPDD